MVGTSRSIPMIATCTGGSELTSRPLPSFVTRQIEPVSDDAEVRARDPDVGRQERLAQLRPRGVRQRLELRREPARRSTAERSSATCSAVFSIAGATMCTGCSPASWRMYSPRSVSTGVTPTASSAAFRPISSVAIDFDFAASFAPAPRGRRRRRTRSPPPPSRAK